MVSRSRMYPSAIISNVYLYYLSIYLFRSAPETISNWELCIFVAITPKEEHEDYCLHSNI